MPMESLVKSCSLQNIFWASQQNSVAEFSYKTEVDGDLFFFLHHLPAAELVHTFQMGCQLML